MKRSLSGASSSASGRSPTLPSSEQSQPLRVAIVGAGIAGVVALSALLKAVEVEGTESAISLSLYESASKYSDLGVGLSFGTNAVAAFRLGGIDAAYNAVVGTEDLDSSLWYDFIHSETGEKKGHVFGSVRSHGRIDAVHRADFMDELSSTLPLSITRFNHRCTGYSPSPSGGVELHFSDRPSVEVDIAIGADGVKSRLRRDMVLAAGGKEEDAAPVYAQWVVWRGVVDAEEYKKVVSANLKSTFCGHGRHLLTFPIRNGTLVNIVGYVRDPQSIQNGGRASPWNEAQPPSELFSAYSGFSAECQALLGLIKEPSKWGVFRAPYLDSYVDARCGMALIGDGAHGTTPHCGGGAGQAVEDGVLLAALLGSKRVLLGANGASIPAEERKAKARHALRVWDDLRRPRAESVTRSSEELGKLIEYLGSEGEGSDGEMILESIRNRMGQIWGFDLRAEVKKALKQLK